MAPRPRNAPPPANPFAPQPQQNPPPPTTTTIPPTTTTTIPPPTTTTTTLPPYTVPPNQDPNIAVEYGPDGRPIDPATRSTVPPGTTIPPTTVSVNADPDQPEAARIPVKFDPTAFEDASGQFDIGRRQARARIRDRLVPNRGHDPVSRRLDGVSANQEKAAEEIASLVVDSIPDGYTTNEVMEQIDLRPYIQSIQGTDLITETQQKEAVKFLNTLQDEILKSVSSSAALEGGKLSTEELNQVLDNVQTFDPTTAGKSPKVLFDQSGDAIANAPTTEVTDPTTGEVTTQLDPAAMGEDTFMRYMNGAEDGGATVSIPVNQQWTVKVQNDAATVNDLVIAESLGQDVPGIAMSSTDQIPVNNPGGNAFFAGSGEPQYQKIKPSAARKYLDTLDEGQMEMLQNQMLKAGFYDTANGTTRPRLGDSWDPATATAWDKVLTYSVYHNVPVDKALDIETAKRQKATTEDIFGKFLPTEAKKTADKLAIDMIGRELTPEEFSTVTKILGRMRDTRAKDVRNVSPDMAWLTSDTQATGYGEEDVNSAVDTAVGSANEIEKFRQTMAIVNAKWGLDARDKDSPMKRAPITPDMLNENWGSNGAA